MSEVNKLALEDVAKRPDGKRDKAQPVQVVKQRKQKPFVSSLAAQLDKALKGDE